LRVETICRLRGLSASDAKQLIRETDQGRRDFISKYFNREIGDPHLYDLVINRASLDEAAVADVIASHWCRQFAINASA
jgi:cytidylate kinase